VAYAFGTLDEMGSGPGFRKVRQALGVEAFGVNALVMAPGHEGFMHYHDTQDELYFVHSGTARFEVAGETRDLGPGGFLHAPSTTHRKVSNAGSEECVVLIVGAKDGYVGRDGQLVDPADLERRKSFGSGN
jgi:mannose-6-phosphate isomerase-like protein (cupin superfamily)